MISASWKNTRKGEILSVYYAMKQENNRKKKSGNRAIKNVRNFYVLKSRKNIFGQNGVKGYKACNILIIKYINLLK
jgi:site-specific recombinase XerD